MRQLATIQTILDIQPIPDADSIEVATVMGWHVVVRKGEFCVGDKIVYLEIDSVLQPNDKYSFMESSNWRLKTKKLRGQISQGLILPYGILSEFLDTPFDGTTFNEGDDVTEIMGITKYEPPVPASLGGSIKGSFPGFLHKTDTERIQSNIKILRYFSGATFRGHEKLDGSSCTVYIRDEDFGVCSRNLDVRESEGNSFWQVVRKYDLEAKMRSNNLNYVALQGELIGPGVQKNKYKLNELDLYLFDVYDIVSGKYLSSDDGKAIAGLLGLKWCPYIMDVTLTEDTTVEELLALAEGKSVLNPQQEREGLVWRPLSELDHPRMGRVAFKTISNKFLLKNED